ncbi:hypothetical protein QVD17_09876 [Tagetes erecta]|uniref:Proline dehydrogenase n=1 Tax=Tagetes erecta TaxID=13708 RepID=A0AAD8L1R5_TARER|nr:hypothetical protein QVD17_09876 [Tagetes erecta]
MCEDTSIQPAIDYMTYWACVKYNELQRPMIFGTIQAYLKDAGERMYLTKKAADKMGLPVGFKLVRGAYMSSERKLARSLGVESPIHDTISGKMTARKAREYGITKDSEKLEFASLYGMADAMTFGLRNAGFSVSKYLPFGPVDQIMP